MPSVGIGRYELVVRGELSARFAPLFAGMDLEPAGATTVLAGEVTDQAHLLGLIEQVGELGLELISVNPRPAEERPCAGPTRSS